MTNQYSEKVSVNMNTSTLAGIDMLVDNGYYSNRSDFINQADGGSHISALSAKVCLEQANAYYTSPAFKGSSTARDQVGALLTKCLTLYGDDVDAQIKEAFAEAIKKCKYS